MGRPSASPKFFEGGTNIPPTLASDCPVTDKLVFNLNFDMVPVGTRPVSEQAHQPLVVDLIALAGGRFEAVVVDDGDLAAVIADEPRALQLSGGFGDPGAAHAKHRCK